MYDTREAAAAACEYEAVFANHYMKVALAYAMDGQCRKAWDMADQARTAAKCAMLAHEKLWEFSGGNLTEKEQVAFEKAEIAWADATRAEHAAAAAVEMVVRECRN